MSLLNVFFLFFFFFQAEDGIRDVAVTGVQTCALPISPVDARRLADPLLAVPLGPDPRGPGAQPPPRHFPLEGLRQSEAHAGGPRHRRLARSGLAGAAGRPLGDRKSVV